MILDMRNIYTKYLDPANKIIKKCNKIQLYALRLKQELYISNGKRKQPIILFKHQIVNVKYYKKMIDVLQSSVFAKPGKLLPFIKKFINQCNSVFIHALSSFVNKQLLNKSQG